MKRKLARKASHVQVVKRALVLPVAASCLLCLATIAARAQQTETKPPEPGQLGQPGSSGNSLTKLPDTVSAPPFTMGDKWEYRVVQTIGLRGWVAGGIGASIGQARNAPHEWGQEFGGFAERYASGFAGNLSRQTFAFVLEAALHEDPRYFPSEDKRMKMRALNALKQVIVCKTDDGRSSFAYGRVISDFGASQFINIWQPKSTGSVHSGITRGFIGLGADAAYTFLQEFVPFTRPYSIRHRRHF